MDKRFVVSTWNATSEPQQTVWRAMHQCYNQGFNPDNTLIDEWSEEEYGNKIVKHLLAGDRGHYGCLEHPSITFEVGFFPHTVIQQLRTHRVGVTFDVQSFRYTGKQIVEVGEELLNRFGGTPDSGQIIDNFDEVYNILDLLFYITKEITSDRGHWKGTENDLWLLNLQELNTFSQAVDGYYHLVEERDIPYQVARNIIPYAIRQHFSFSVNARSLMHILDLRAKANAQYEIRCLCDLLMVEFEKWMPQVASWYNEKRWQKARLAP